MTPPSAVDLGAEIIATLIRSGVTQIVLSPGARSAPLSVAAARAADRHELQLQVRIDERSAAFTALGMARVTGTPTAVMCTSGTATTNFLPAIVEARYSGVPLVVITADRPPELRGSGASQTIDQVGMFDQYVLGSWDLPVEPAAGEFTTKVAMAVALAGRARGPVHINVPFRPPLVGQASAVASDAVPPESAEAAPLAEPVDLGQLPAQGVFVVGDLDVWDEQMRREIEKRAADWGWPVVAEATSGLTDAETSIPAGNLLLDDAEQRTQLRPEMIISVGPFGLHRGQLAFVGEAERHIAVQVRPRTDPPDPLRSAEQVLRQLPTGNVDVDPHWLPRWRSAAATQPQLTGPQTDVATVAQTIWQELDQRDLLVVAPSMSIRGLSSCSGPGPNVIANRGANGIDGFISTAWGAASVWRGGRTVALLGDLALLHDQNGLLVPETEPRPDLTLVIADNNGGGIFGQLEMAAAEYSDVFERVFGTAHDRDLAAVLQAAQVPVVVAEDPAELAQLLQDETPGMRAVVVPVSR